MGVVFKHFGIEVDGSGLPSSDQKQYESTVGATINILTTSVVTQAVFYRIRRFGRVKIIPYNNASDLAKYGVCNALAVGDGDESAHDGWLYGLQGHVTVRYSPNTWINNPGCSNGPGFRYQDILLHELVHAARFLGSDHVFNNDFNFYWAINPTLLGYENQEEFIAILLTNIYMSETGQKTLRLDHGSTQHPASMNGSSEFLSNGENLKVIREFCRQHNEIAPMIAKSTAPFNPIRAFYETQN